MIARPQQQTTYGRVAQTLHWLIAGMLIVQFPIAWLMPHIGPRTQPDTTINLHLSFGTTIMLIVIIRLLWRLTHPVPPALASVPRWQRAAATVSHVLLYLILLTLPTLGWASASARGFTVSLFGIIPLPGILPAHSRLAGPIGDLHTTEAYTLLGLVGLHVAAALYHHFILKDETLRRMLPIGLKNTGQ